MTLQQRAEAFARAFPKWPAAWPRVVEEKGRPVLYAVFVLGNDYRLRSSLYGAYPAGRRLVGTSGATKRANISRYAPTEIV